jgi:hypothetical protein
VWIVKERVAATMQQFVLMVDELEKFPAAKHHLLVLLRWGQAPSSECSHRAKFVHNSASVFDV